MSLKLPLLGGAVEPNEGADHDDAIAAAHFTLTAGGIAAYPDTEVYVAELNHLAEIYANKAVDQLGNQSQETAND